MKRIAVLALVASLAAGPALAVPVDDDRDKKAQPTLAEVMDEAARVVVAEDAEPLETPAPAAQDGGRETWKVIVGVGLIAGGVGLIANGFALEQDEPDRFGRVKDADKWAAIGVGGTFAAIGAFVLRSGLTGEGF